MSVRARAASAVVFFATGAVFASWASRIPAVQQRLELSPGQLGLALLGLEAGAIVGLPLGALLAARLGSRRSLRLGFTVYPSALAAVAVAPDLGWLIPALALMAVGNSMVDVAMNAQGVELERRFGRPVLSGLHAGHSLGVLGGGVVGTAAAAADVQVGAHFVAAAAVCVVTGLAMTVALVAEPPVGQTIGVGWPSGQLLALGAIAFCAFLLDGAANNWAAVHLRTELGAGQSLAAGGFTAFALTLAAGRLVGDRLVTRHGRRRVVRAGGLIAAGGVGMAMTALTPVPAIIGWAVLGGGMAVIAPTVLGAAAEVADTPVPVAIAAVSTVGYLGSFTGPPLVGGLAPSGRARSTPPLVI